jgi:hypothetical protein
VIDEYCRPKRVRFLRIVMAGLDPAIPLNQAQPRHTTVIAGSSLAMTVVCPLHLSVL